MNIIYKVFLSDINSREATIAYFANDGTDEKLATLVPVMKEDNIVNYEAAEVKQLPGEVSVKRKVLLEL